MELCDLQEKFYYDFDLDLICDLQEKVMYNAHFVPAICETHSITLYRELRFKKAWLYLNTILSLRISKSM